MKLNKKLSFSSLFLIQLLFLFLTGCHIRYGLYDDDRPVEIREKNFYINNFTKLDIGNAMRVNVQRGDHFSVSAKGDRINVDDIDMTERNGVLKIYYRNNRNRRFPMDISIVMPNLRAVFFSGASESNVEGFDTGIIDIVLSDASKAAFNVRSQFLNIDLSGASSLNISGECQKINGYFSGASNLYAFNLYSDEAEIDASGASSVRINILKYLKARASGASRIRYRGNPSIDRNLSGGSTLERD